MKRLAHALSLTFLGTSVALVLGALLAVLLGALARGTEGLSVAFLVEDPTNAGRAGGVAPVLFGTVAVLLVALLAVLPVGLGAAVWLSEFAPRRGPAATAVRVGLDTLAGVPSIVFGLFGMSLFVDVLGLGWSILSGGLTLATMVLPVFVRAAEEGLRAVPWDQRAGALALGLTRAAALRRVLLPQASPGIAAGLGLALGRCLAETAAVMFTAGASVRWPTSVHDPARTLAYHVYLLAVEVPGGAPRAWTSALVLLALVVLTHEGVQYCVRRVGRLGAQR
jgi:phosphate transport system permease protein